jgi:hypothetical protein
MKFIIPDQHIATEGFIGDEDHRDSYEHAMEDPDWYEVCGTDVNQCEVVGMTAYDKAYLEGLFPAPSYESSCHKKCYNHRTDDMDDYSYERDICETYYNNFAVYSVDRTAGKVFIAPRPPQRSTPYDNAHWRKSQPTPVMSKCFGAEQEREDPDDFTERPKNIISVRHKNLDRRGYWLSAEQNQEFLWDWLGFIEADQDALWDQYADEEVR